MEECLRAPAVRRLSEATASWWRLSGWGRGGSCSLFPLTTQIALTKGLQIALWRALVAPAARGRLTNTPTTRRISRVSRPVEM